jgi:hypothetical protein
MLLALSLVMVLGVAACGEDDDDSGDASADPTTAASEEPSDEPTEAEGPQEVTIVATEFHFDIPEVSPGETEITLQNDGKQPHFLYLLELTDDAPPLKEALKLPEKEADKFIAGKPEESKVVEPGETTTLTVDLQPGRYAALCFIDDPKSKTPHAFLGMAEEFNIE